MVLRVERCRYALGADQELQEVAAAFGLDWMRLWSLNGGLLHPDYVLFADQVLWVGHLFRAAGGEAPAALAARMGMSASRLQQLNMDLDVSAPLAAGQAVCVVPDSCRGAAQTVYSSIPYADPAAVARQLADSQHVPGAAAAELLPAAPAP